MRLWLAILFTCIIHTGIAQVAGCTDPLASNYNAAATINNGSCVYNSSSYTAPVKLNPFSDSLVEGSGLQMADGHLWSFNDGGGGPVLYRIDTSTGQIVQRVLLAGTTNTDWEDIAFDGSNLYIADAGNNYNGARTNLKLYKLPLAAIPNYQANPVAVIAQAQIEVLEFIYSNQPQPPVAGSANSTRFDCEAIIADHNSIHLFTKNWADNNTIHYRINGTTAGQYIATPVDTLASGYLVTAADKVPGQDIVVLLGYQNSGTGRHYLSILSNYNADAYFSGNIRKIDLPDATQMGQAEGLCFTAGKQGFISNEQFNYAAGSFLFTVNQQLRWMDLSNFVNDYFTQYVFTGSGNWSDASNWKNNQPPPARLSAGNSIVINPTGTGYCILDIAYTLPPQVSLTIAAGKNLQIMGQLLLQ
jgi:hypothetical protein